MTVGGMGFIPERLLMMMMMKYEEYTVLCAVLVRKYILCCSEVASDYGQAIFDFKLNYRKQARHALLNRPHPLHHTLHATHTKAASTPSQPVIAFLSPLSTRCYGSDGEGLFFLGPQLSCCLFFNAF